MKALSLWSVGPISLFDLEGDGPKSVGLVIPIKSAICCFCRKLIGSAK